MAKERVLAFGCHPDDIEFRCSGTLALLAQRGYEIHLAVIAGGEMGSATHPPQQVREIRLRENANSAALIGAQFHFAGGYDLEVEYNADYRRMAVRVIREVDPLLVFTTPPMDYHIDHEETSRLVRHACFSAPIPNYDCGVPSRPSSRVPYLYYFNATGHCDIFGRPLPLTCAVDVSGVMAIKEKMLACHESQSAWLAKHHGYDKYLEVMKDDAARDGQRAGFPFAEGFIQHRGSGYPGDNLLKTVLGELCREY